MPRAFLLFLAVLAAAAGAQSYRDSFDYPDGTVVPGWTEQSGDWLVSGGRLYLGGPVGIGYKHITKDGWNVRHSVTEARIFYEGPLVGIRAAGLTARLVGTWTIWCAIQDNTEPIGVGFDSFWLYERPGTGSHAQINLPAFLSCRVRLLVHNATASVQVDTNGDGAWDLAGTTALSLLLAAGEHGCSSAFLTPQTRSPGIDDFALFDAVLTSTGTAQPGTTLTLNLQGNVPGAPYQAAAAFAAAPGIPVDTRSIPLAPDALTVLSLSLPSVFQGFTGGLNGTGAGTARIAIPAVPALAGVVFHSAFVTLSGGAPSGIASISNDHRIAIVP
jgi:hypothetical protein